MAGENNDLIMGLGAGAMQLVANLDLASSTKALRLPRLTTAQRDAMNDSSGLLIFNSTTGKLNFNTGSGWEVVTSA